MNMSNMSSKVFYSVIFFVSLFKMNSYITDIHILRKKQVCHDVGVYVLGWGPTDV